MTIFTAAIEQASDILWNSLLLFLLVGTGVFFHHPAGGAYSYAALARGSTAFSAASPCGAKRPMTRE